MTKIDILSDPICPWCLIGNTFLDRALKARPTHDFDIEWYPFMLNPEMETGGMLRQHYLNLKFGSKENAKKIYNKIEVIALTNDIEINFDKIKRTPNTMDPHRLIHWAGPKKQKQVMEQLFNEYFVNGNDISEHRILIKIADKIGLKSNGLAADLKSNKDIKNVVNRVKNASKRGVTGVPCFIIDHKYVLQGAQPTELWIKVIDEILGNEEP